MHAQQRCWSLAEGWSGSAGWEPRPETSLVLVLGPRALLTEALPIQQVRAQFPNAQIVGCSTAGEIAGTRVHEGMLVFTAIEFTRSHVRVVQTDITGPSGSAAAGQELARALRDPDLAHVMVLSDGLHVNGSELIAGLNRGLPKHIAVTGGLAGDGADFGETVVHLNGVNAGDRIVAIGLYGDRLRVGYGSGGGWDSFGPERLVTRSSGNVLYELDGESALQLYEKYLGEHARGLPASALRFPLSVRATLQSTPVVRTILGIDRDAKSMTFAGDIVQGTFARLMRADINRLIDGASQAAQVARSKSENGASELAILISCVGRKLVLKQRVEEEIEAVRDVVGPAALLAGFYSYGEICPFGPGESGSLHNQTMTVTTLSEAA